MKVCQLMKRWKVKMNKYQVITSRKSDYPNPISVSKGQMVKCLKKSDEDSEWSGWIYCESDHNKGWIPEQIIDLKGKMGIILEDYSAKEFYLEVDDILIEIKELNGWIWCFKSGHEDEKAWAPLDHLKLIARRK